MSEDRMVEVTKRLYDTGTDGVTFLVYSVGMRAPESEVKRLTKSNKAMTPTPAAAPTPPAGDGTGDKAATPVTGDTPPTAADPDAKPISRMNHGELMAEAIRVGAVPEGTKKCLVAAIGAITAAK